MADYYKTAIEKGLRDYATKIGKTYPNQLYEDLAWGGLHGTKKLGIICLLTKILLKKSKQEL